MPSQKRRPRSCSLEGNPTAAIRAESAAVVGGWALVQIATSTGNNEYNTAPETKWLQETSGPFFASQAYQVCIPDVLK